MSGAAPRLYSDLAWLWPFVSPPANYVEEVATFRARFRRHGVPDGGRVLHLGCGGGSIDHHLQHFYRVTGVDVSEPMLAHARRLNPDVDYRVGDIRTCRLDATFDAVLAHDAVSYMTTEDELAAVYATAAAHLRPGGVLVALPEEIPERTRHDRHHVETHDADGRHVTIVQLSHDPDPTDTTLENVFLFVIREQGDLRVEVDRHVNGVFPLARWLALIEAAGFEAAAEPWELTDWPAHEVPLPLITAVRR